MGMVDRELYPFESKYCVLRDLNLHYIDEGSGAPVVMVHGNPTWSFYYRNLAKALREDHRVIVPDHIGCGLSDKPGDDRYDYTLKSRVDDLEGLLDSVGVRKDITLILHDWGGMIGMAYATRYPERIKRIVLLNTAAFLLPAGRSLPWSLKLVRDSCFGAFLVRGCNAFSLGATFVCCRKKPMSRRLRRAYTAPYDGWDNRIATLRFVQDIPMVPADKSYAVVREVEDRLKNLTGVPMMICWGGKDFVFDDSFLKEWITRFPDADVHRFSDAGHYVLEDAAEEIIPLVKKFLSREAAGSPS